MSHLPSICSSLRSLPHQCVRLICVLWALPCSLLGGLLAVIWLLFGGKLRFSEGALEVSLPQSSALAAWLECHQSIQAITLGHVIVALRSDALDQWHAHERVHVRQFEAWGALLLLAYPAASFWAAWRGRDPYLGNYFEREAYAKG